MFEKENLFNLDFFNPLHIDFLKLKFISSLYVKFKT